MPSSHDPVPDGRSGPFCRTRHKHDENGALTHDPRCGKCSRDAVEAEVTRSMCGPPTNPADVAREFVRLARTDDEFQDFV